MRAEQFKDILLKRRFTVGECIPSERQLAEKYKVSRATIGRVVSELVAEGVLDRKWGKGVFYLGSRSVHIFVLMRLELMTRAANPYAWFTHFDLLKGILSATRGGMKVDLCESIDELERLCGGAGRKYGAICIGANEFADKMPSGVPCVLFNNYGVYDFPSVDCDVKGGTYMGARQLIHKGYKRIAFVGGPFAHPSQQLRLEGYQQALTEIGCRIVPELVAECSFGDKEGELAADRLLRGRLMPDVVMCSDDMRAVGVYRALKRRNLRIPQDVGILGFDDNPETADFEVPLSTLRFPRVEMGEKAVVMLTSLINNPSGSRVDEVLPMSLVMRASC